LRLFAAKLYKPDRLPGETEPTVKEIERDACKLLFEHADGELVVKNKRSVISGRKREVIDDIHKDRLSQKKLPNQN
jgi:hypothetical protein